MLAQGLDLAIYGMGTVFVFLTLLVYATRLMSMLILATVEDEPVAPVSVTDVDRDRRRIAAVVAAVEQYRRDHE